MTRKINIGGKTYDTKKIDDYSLTGSVHTLSIRFPEVGADRAKTRAENHKKRYGIEYFSQKDVEMAVAEIKRATHEFFSN